MIAEAHPRACRASSYRRQERDLEQVKALFLAAPFNASPRAPHQMALSQRVRAWIRQAQRRLRDSASKLRASFTV